ncbi:hypothetical protein GCM10009530_60090 [Microbispora corallina]|uniref:Condensation domain-containing protein n=1 Tax=Microbispora corallina TaxID=83302 RepID=A0ABQ4FYW5_9ACTN|nr:condensation domain-containing protein [Microbispora corallina]GIH39995.1 hypothetical protein Mco01_29950 [Microbispora corallina]
MTVSETAHAPAGERIPLSVQQEFLCMWDKGDDMGPFGPRYHIVDGWRIGGELDLDTLRAALDDVVARHEALRTTVVRDDRYQRILPPSPVPLTVLDLPGVDPSLRDLRTEELLNDIAAGTISVRELPLLRAVLGRFDERDAVLALIAHHTAADAWSMQLIMRDLAACYGARLAGAAPDLPEPAQYREYAAWQRERLSAASTATARDYWRERLRDARALALPTDRLRSQEPEFSTAWYRFSYGPELRTALTGVAARTRSSPFMVLLAAFAVFVHRTIGTTDVVVPTFTPGRDQAQFQDAVGSFFNCLPLRVDLSGCATFADVVARTRSACLSAYSREIPLAQVLGEAPELMSLTAVDGLASCVFQVIQTPHMMERDRVGDLEFSAVRRRMLAQTVGSDIPDGTLLCLELDSTGDLIGELGYSSNLYDKSTAMRIVAELGEVLRDVLGAPAAPLGT